MTLGGEWQLRGFLGDEWRWHLEKPWDAPGWIPARVPGSVVDDLWRAGEVPDPYHARNSRLLEWVPERAWVYRRPVDGPGVIRFEGVDHAATVFVDGQEVAEHEGAFTPFEVELDEGEHALAVVVHPAPASEPQVGRTSRVRVHKSRMGYGWDFCPRMIHQGIWRPVTLNPSPPVRPTVRLEDGLGTVELHGEVVLRVDEPRLWWPNGMGEQHLYEVDGVRVGFRTVELTSDYALVVNGVRAPIKGWNWCPLDPLYGVPRPEKLRRLLELAAASGANLVRVWGGGLIETDEFYDHCDRLGLLVWQEFSQSSSGIESVPSDDPGFVATLAADAREIVPRLRHRPSLAIWGGGNELDGDDSTPALAALRAVVHELDPGRVVARELAVAGRPRPARAVGAPGPPQALRALRLPRLRAPQRVRRRGHDEPRGARGADPGGGALAGRPDEPRLRAPRRVVEQRSLRAGGVRRPDRRPRDDAPRFAVAAVRRPPLRGRGEPAARRRDDPVAAQRVLSERLVHGRRRLPRPAEARVLGRAAGLRGGAERLVRHLRVGWRRGGTGAHLGRRDGAHRRARRQRRRRGGRRDRRAASQRSAATSSCSTSRAATATS